MSIQLKPMKRCWIGFDCMLRFQKNIIFHRVMFIILAASFCLCSHLLCKRACSAAAAVSQRLYVYNNNHHDYVTEEMWCFFRIMLITFFSSRGTQAIFISIGAAGWLYSIEGFCGKNQAEKNKYTQQEPVIMYACTKIIILFRVRV